MGAVRGREGIVDPDVAIGGQRLDEGRIILFLAGMETGVLQKEDVAILHRRHRLGRDRFDAIGGESDRLVDDLGDLLGDRRQALLGIGSLRASEMGQQDDLGVGAREFQDRRGDTLDPGRVGDDAVLHRHIEVDAQQDALAGDVADVVEGAEGGHGPRNFPAAAMIPTIPTSIVPMMAINCQRGRDLIEPVFDSDEADPRRPGTDLQRPGSDRRYPAAGH